MWLVVAGRNSERARRYSAIRGVSGNSFCSKNLIDAIDVASGDGSRVMDRQTSPNLTKHQFQLYAGIIIIIQRASSRSLQRTVYSTNTVLRVIKSH